MDAPFRGVAAPTTEPARQRAPSRHRSPPKPLSSLRHQSTLVRTEASRERSDSTSPPYPFAHRDLRNGGFLDLSTDGDDRWLDYYRLPHFQTPLAIAEWLQLPVGKVAWLTYRFCENHRPQSAKEAHYHFRWVRKRSGGHRLIEAPKRTLKAVQQKILRDILNKVSPHSKAHGFVNGRSILSNARPHVGQAVVLKFDLENFYGTVRYSRVVGIFRSLGYSREAALWLARLTTSAAPGSLKLPLGESASIWKYMPRHLPQGAPTSPALANLSAYALDVRLTGLAKAWHLQYTRYADDLTFSGDGKAIAGLREFIPLVEAIIRDEGFRVARSKRRVLRASQRQEVAGVVVNEKVNVCRRDYDRLKAILNNCRRHGPASQNLDRHENFAAHLRGRIGHVMQLNAQRGAKLLEMFERIRWE
ncbi:MAG: reverse transcriptase family protein [Planctomycetaceae bacterium]